MIHRPVRRPVSGRLRHAALLFFVLLAGSALATDRVPDKRWQRWVDPAEVGFAPAGLESARAWFDSSGSAAVMIVHRGAVLCDWGQTTRRFNLHSARKSIMSAMYGIHIADGAIDTNLTLAELGIDEDTPLTDEERSARIADLLSARSGIYLPAAYEPAQNPKPPRGSHAPGTNWCYNNWDFNTLLTILEQATGVDFFVDVDQRLARPLQMQDYEPLDGYHHFERDKSRHAAYPIRMSARDMARFGLLYLRRGLWGDRRILPAAYVDHSTAHISEGTWTGGYGYMWWLYDEEPFRSLGLYSARGLGGQTIDVLPAADLVVVTRGDTFGGGGYPDTRRLELLRRLLDARCEPTTGEPRLEPLPEPAQRHATRPWDAARLRELSGAYRLPDGTTVTAEARGERLVLDTGRGVFPVLNLGEDRYLLEDYEQPVRFIADPAGDRPRLVVPDLNLRAGVNLLQTGRRDEAAAAIAEVVEAFPDNADAREWQARIRIGEGMESLHAAAGSLRRAAALDSTRRVDRSPLVWALQDLLVSLVPPEVPADRLQVLAGRYGPYTVACQDGELTYRRGEQPPRRLRPITDMIFNVEGAPGLRIEFESGPDGRPARLVAWFEDGRRQPIERRPDPPVTDEAPGADRRKES